MSTTTIAGAPSHGARWLPAGWTHPVHVPVDDGHHLRPIRADDVDLDLPAVHGSRDRLWSIYGRAWGWPPVAMTLWTSSGEPPMMAS